YPIDGFVFNPNDLADIQLTKDDVGRYIMGDPASPAGITSIWGVPTAESASMDAGTWLGGNFAMGATLFDRWDSTVTAGYKNDDFTKNKITLLAEERIALAIYSDVAFITGDVAPEA
ncbi:MAG TPA: phage major capsid protein, partial [Pseudomonadales bacterium]|nr:phage major capsid protein [Pseudomonadales bacterium]